MRHFKNKKIFLTLVIIGIFLIPGTAFSFKIDSTKVQNNEKIVLEYLDDGFELTYNLEDLTEEIITNEHGDFTQFSIKNQGFVGELGKAKLPVVSFTFAVPNVELDLELVNSHISETKSVGYVYPAQKAQIDDDIIHDTEFAFDESFYQKDINYPFEISKIANRGNIRDISFVKINFYPVQYNPKKEIATIYDQIIIKLSFKNTNVLVESSFEKSKYFSFYKNIFVNFDEFIDNSNIVEDNKSPRQEGCEYLIISHPDFYSDVEALALWKNSKGIITKLVDTSVTGSSSNEIKSYIQDAYQTWDPRPSYVLLVGDSEYIPTSSSGTDLYYFTVDGSDYFADMFYGRIPVDSSQEADIVIQKILSYEQNPPSSQSFYENFAVAAYFQDDEGNGYETRRFVRTSEEVRDYLLSLGYEGERIYCTESYINPTHYNNGYYGNGEPLPEELLRPDFAWDGDADDIINAVDGGVFILNHRDHGSETYWGDPYFDTGHIGSLSNGNLLPVVFSINCLTGKFDNYECFCESFLRKEDGGAVAVFGATRVSYSGYNDFLCRGFYDAYWPDFDTDIGGDQALHTLGEMLNYGKSYMTQTWGDPWGYEEYTFKLFHCFGDPTMEIWTSYPKELDISYVFEIGEIEINVKDGSTTLDNALVCLKQDSGFYVKGFTDSTGKITLDTTGADIFEEVDLCVSAHNYKPYQETFILNQAPETPDKPIGPSKIKVYTEYTYSSVTTDVEGNELYYKWRWGDGSESEWIGPFSSGETASASHMWDKSAHYYLRVKAKDEHGVETNYSEKLNIHVTKSRSMHRTFVNEILIDFFEKFPIIRSFFIGFL